MKRVLVIRGGAIGDFILTLPALKALRDAWPNAHVEILGYKHIAALAENRFYAQAVRSIEYGALASFFARDADLPADLAKYFASFDLILNYLYDPDEIFRNNLRRCEVKRLIPGPGRMDNSEHAARQLARPIEEIGITVIDLAERVFPSTDDRQFAREFLRDLPQPIVAIHPGSGSEKKNWPIEKWTQLLESLDASSTSKAATCRPTPKLPLIIISGEGDEKQIERLQDKFETALFAKNLPLTQLAAILENAIYIGHDSGISHLAAAAGAHCVLLFGPTDPKIWAPLNENARVLRAPDHDLQKLDVDAVRQTILSAIQDSQAGSPAPLSR